MRCLVTLAAVSCCWVIAGCGLGVDDPPTHHPDAGVVEVDGAPAPKLTKPSVERPPDTVCGSSVPIQGTAAPGASVFAQGGLDTAGVATDAHPVSGRFCVDIRLKLGASNLIEVRTQDPVLGISDPATVTVKQSSAGCSDTPPPQQPDPQNIALGLKARAKAAPVEGNEGFLTDGNLNTAVKYQTFTPVVDANFWLTIKLVKLTELSKIVVKWRSSSGSGTDFATRFKVLVSAMGEPGDPSLTNGYWTEMESFEAAAGGVNTIDLSSSKPAAMHVALWMNADDGWSPYDNFTLAELEVWDNPKKVTTQTNTETTCSSLGL